MREKKMGTSTHYIGRLSNLNLIIVPGEEAGLEPGAKGTHLIEVKIADFDRFITHARSCGLSDISPMEMDGVKQAFFSDPDGNPWMVFNKESK